MLLDFDTAEPTTVYCEGVTGALYLDKPVEVATYDAIWHGLVERTLDAGQSTGLITALAEEYSHG